VTATGQPVERATAGSWGQVAVSVALTLIVAVVGITAFAVGRSDRTPPTHVARARSIA